MTDVLNERVDRLTQTVYKLAGWLGQDVSELFEADMLKEGDLDRQKVRSC